MREGKKNTFFPSSHDDREENTQPQKGEKQKVKKACVRDIMSLSADWGCSSVSSMQFLFIP